jgi:hypothetical protein
MTTTAAHSPLDQKILEHFPGLVVRKDLTTELKQNAVVPTYVLEYLLGQHCATDDPTLIQEGLESVRRILSKHYVHRNQAELVKSTIKERGTHKVIDKLTVDLNEKGGFYEVEFTNLGLKMWNTSSPPIPRPAPGRSQASNRSRWQASTTTSSSRPGPSSPPMSGWTCSCRAWASTPSRSPVAASCSP